jgi:hypothetical protein
MFTARQTRAGNSDQGTVGNHRKAASKQVSRPPSNAVNHRHNRKVSNANTAAVAQVISIAAQIIASVVLKDLTATDDQVEAPVVGVVGADDNALIGSGTSAFYSMADA